MKTTINVLMIDDSESTTNKAQEYFSSHAVINVVKALNSGREGLEYILNNPSTFDMLVLDIIMPEIDGISILEEMKEKNIEKKVIVSSSFKQEATMKLINKFNVDYFMVKPLDMNVLEKRILNIASPTNEEVEIKDNKIELEISKTLHALGIPSHIRGYQYIRESVYMMYENPDMIGGITKCIYPEIALRFDTTASRVERAIRHAIEVSWARGDYEVMEALFGHSVDYDRSKPTNSEFIATIADNLRLNKQYVNA